MEKYIIKTDGGARGNPGPAGIGAVLFDFSDKVLAKAKKYIGRATNNEAEYQAVFLGLELARRKLGKEKCQKTDFDFKLDSELVVKQLNGQYQIKEERLWPMFMKIWNLRVKDFPHLSFSYIRREENKLADKLVNEALDEAGK
ncbi:MAG TPA: ribonuclease HI family protein [Candidatus Vogelbacteria bacterium]|nr:ribonuclease HI family protein [Candidatus Vogelbacteria bacterium]